MIIFKTLLDNNNNKLYLGTETHKVNYLLTMKLCMKQQTNKQ